VFVVYKTTALPNIEFHRGHGQASANRMKPGPSFQL